jgi:fatty acid desaturase/nitrite reductase/ring-hydroxylating ferredoxin subunit
MERENRRPARDTALWAALLAGTGTAAFVSLKRRSGWAVAAFAAFGALYGGSADARWHENGHGTAFKAKWANDATYRVASFMLLREPTLWRWSHFRHHSDTIIVGRDAEISFPRPTKLVPLLLNYLNLVNGPRMLRRTVQHAAGRIDGATRELVPPEDLPRLVREARVHIVVLGTAVVAGCISGTIVPLLFVGLPSFYGAWLAVFFGITQHAGLREDVLDHRLNTRTVYMNPVFRFLYLNMNYHLEHHLFPAVPYYNLPQLHQELKAYLPPPKPSVLAAYREIVHALRRQRRDVTWELTLPELLGGLYRRSPAEPAEQTTREAPSEDGRSGPGTDHRPCQDDGSYQSVDLGPIGALGTGEVQRVELEGHIYALYRLEADKFALTDGLCTHTAAELSEGYLDGCVIECPKHNGRFDVRTGEAVRRPATQPLRTYSVDVVGGRVVARLARTASTEGG